MHHYLSWLSFGVHACLTYTHMQVWVTLIELTVCALPVCIKLPLNCTVCIKTHDSESRGQEEAGRTRRRSELFTGSTAVKFVNTLNKPPLKLSLSYQGLSTF